VAVPFDFKYKVRWWVDTNDINEGVLTVWTNGLTASPNPLPDQYAVYNYFGNADLNAFAKTFSFRRLNATQKATRWLVEVDFIPLDKQKGEDGNPPVSNPLNRPASWWMEGQSKQIPLGQAKNLEALAARPANTFGPVVNAVEEEFDDPLSTEKATQVWVAQKNVATFQTLVNEHGSYHNRVNSNVIWTKPAGTVKFVGVTAGQATKENDVVFRSATYRFLYDPDGHDRDVVNLAYSYLTTPNSMTTQTKDDPENKGHKITTPLLIKLDGTLVSAGAIGSTITYRERDRLDLSALKCFT